LSVFSQLLLKCTDPITEDEEEALAKNRPGADIPGNGAHCAIVVTRR